MCAFSLQGREGGTVQFHCGLFVPVAVGFLLFNFLYGIYFFHPETLKPLICTSTVEKLFLSE